MSPLAVERSVDERAHFQRTDLPEAATVLVPGGFPAPVPDLPATTPVPDLRTGIVSRLVELRDQLAAMCAAEQARGAAFLCVPVALGTGAITYFSLPFEPHGGTILATAAALAALVWFSAGRTILFFLSGMGLAFAAGAGFAKLEAWRASTPVVGSEVSTRVTGRVVQVEHQASGRIRLTLDLARTERPALRHAPERVRLTARAVPEGLRSGDVVQGFARLLPPSGPVRPGGYDFAFASFFNGIGATGFFLSEVVRVEEKGGDLFLFERMLQALETLREALAERIRQHVSGPHGEVAVALITGHRAGIPEEMNEALRRSGLAHVLSISGLHMALVAGTVMLMIRMSAAFFPVFASRVPVKKIAAAAALVFCTLYLSISGAEVAAQRSYLMLAVMLLALMFDRAAISMRNVAIAAIVILVIAPHEIMGPSFQMSFGATGALVAAFAAWTDWRSRRPGGIPSRHPLAKVMRFALAGLTGLALTSLVAGLATTIYGVWHFQRASPYALPANLLAMPVISAVVMPSAVCAILALPFGLEGYFLRAMQWGLGVMVDIATWFSDRSPLDTVGLAPAAATLWFTLALLVLVISTTRLRLAAIPLLALGFIALMNRTLPDVLVTEDARLIGVRGDGVLAINRARGSTLALDDWKRALLAPEVAGSVTLKSDSADGGGPDGRFVCREGTCVLLRADGLRLVHVRTADSALDHCSTAALIVVEDATVEKSCGEGSAALVLTGRELARRGAAAIALAGGGQQPSVNFAVAEPFRPWHAHRAFSRAARGLPPRESERQTRENRGQ